MRAKVSDSSRQVLCKVTKATKAGDIKGKTSEVKQIEVALGNYKENKVRKLLKSRKIQKMTSARSKRMAFKKSLSHHTKFRFFFSLEMSLAFTECCYSVVVAAPTTSEPWL